MKKPRLLGADLLIKLLAERERFELSIELPLYTLSRRAPSTTRTPFQVGGAADRVAVAQAECKPGVLP